MPKARIYFENRDEPVQFDCHCHESVLATVGAFELNEQLASSKGLFPGKATKVVCNKCDRCQIANFLKCET
jgi:hypothetical protein